MDRDEDLLAFALDLQREIIGAADLEGRESFRAEAFTRHMIDELTEAGEAEDGDVCHHRAHGIEVSGYGVDDDERILSLFVTVYTQMVPPTTITRSEIEKRVRRLKAFLGKAFGDYYQSLEEASPSFDMALRIHDLRESIDRVHLYVLTDGLVPLEAREQEDDGIIDGRHLSVRVRDLRYLYRRASSGQHCEPIEIDFETIFGAPIPCLGGSDETDEYAAYLAIIPGDTLAEIYDRYGAQLLELNVRSFLQARGKVNQGIRKTIKDEPGRFLAYNNGISATASSIDLVEMPGGGIGIASVRDLQIVNGGQTTASIHHAARQERMDVSRVRVQAKVTVVPPQDIGVLVPLISRYANSQNKVNEADFSANDAFHVDLEKLSRVVWAPPSGGSHRQTRWFYERARGQYLDALNREGTAARKREFKLTAPKTQQFTKTDVAKYEMTWAMQPQTVSLGAQKCFLHFTLWLAKQRGMAVDQGYVQRLVAKAILFRRAERIVAAQQFGGYRANIVAYTLAYLIHRTDQRIDLQRIWQRQDIGAGLVKAIEIVSRAVYDAITQSSGGRNVTEWCKRTGCWDAVRALEIDVPDRLDEELVPIDEPARSEVVAQASRITPDTWVRVSQWAEEETGRLQGWQQNIARDIGRRLQDGKEPSLKQAEQGIKLLRLARRRGFQSDLPSPGNDSDSLAAGAR